MKNVSVLVWLTVVTFAVAQNTLKQSQFAGLAGAEGRSVRAHADGTLYPDVSSLQYKTEVRDLQPDMKKVLSLRPVQYKLKESGANDIGLIAEEVAQVIPDLVIYFEDGSVAGVKYDRLVVYLLDVLKKQQSTIARHEKDIKSLQNELLSRK